MSKIDNDRRKIYIHITLELKRISLNVFTYSDISSEDEQG